MQQQGFMNCVRTLKSAWGKVPLKKFVSLTWGLIKIIPSCIKFWFVRRMIRRLNWLGSEIRTGEWDDTDDA